MKKIFLLFIMTCAMTICVQAKTLIVYYSYTNNVATITTELNKQIKADVVCIQPVEKGLDYTANNYAIGSALISAIRNDPNDADSYPAIDPVTVDWNEYDTIIIGAPLWWSNMAAPLQTFLFQNGGKMAGKNIGLIVSSASSAINGVESDAKRLIPDGKFLSPSLWIRSSQTSNAASLISDWLKRINYSDLSGIESVGMDNLSEILQIYNLAGNPVGNNPEALSRGIYIVQYYGTEKVLAKKTRI